jgi:hypothetical protein
MQRDKWYFRIYSTAPTGFCALTSLTTDNELTGKTVLYLELSGSKTYAMDKILTQTPSSCGYTSFTYSVREDALGDMSGYGITVDNSASPPNLVINSSIIAPKTYVMTWYATPAGATCLNSISFPFTIKIYCKLTDAT